MFFFAGKVALFLEDLRTCVMEVGVAAAAAKVAQMNGGMYIYVDVVDCLLPIIFLYSTTNLNPILP